jgi:AmmeMemoRadiSam system protein B/AmmeMemoRadiSam system protein A
MSTASPVRSRARVAVALAVLVLSCAATAEKGTTVREAAIAGSWYPEARCLVTADVHLMLRSAAAAPTPGGKPVALVVPHAGWRFSGFGAATAFRLLRPGDFERVVLVAPSHYASFDGFSVPDVAFYRTPLGDIPLDTEAIEKLKEDRFVRTQPGAHSREHAIEIELPFLQSTLERFRLVPILARETTPAMQASLAARLAELNDGKTLFVFSTDFTHYGPRFSYTPYGRSAQSVRDRIAKLDDEAIGFLLRKDARGYRKFLERTSATICGRHGLGVLLELLPHIAPDARSTLLSHYASIDLPGMADDNSVTYVAIAYGSAKPPGTEPLGTPPEPALCPAHAPPLSKELGGRLVRIARATLRAQLEGRDDLQRELSNLPTDRPELDRLQGVFVTLNRTDPHEIEEYGRLRGCIGQIGPTFPLFRAVVIAAAQAALADRRFPPVEREELSRLEVEVTVLSPPRPVESWKEIRIGRHGIVLEKAGNRAVFLPQVATERGWTLEKTLSRLALKAGLPENGWREGASFQVFTGQIFHEQDDARPSGKEG